MAYLLLIVKPLLVIRLQGTGKNTFKGEQKALSALSGYNRYSHTMTVITADISAMGPKGLKLL